MKKFTILLSDDEDDFRVGTNRTSVFPSSTLARDILSAPPTELISTNSQMNNISQEISFVSTNQRCNNILDKINTEYVAPVRSPVPKSDEEIRFWVLTSRPPCLYDPEENEQFSQCVNNVENSQKFDTRQHSINRSTAHFNTGYNSNSLELKYSQNKKKYSTSDNRQIIEKSSTVKEDYFVDEDIHIKNNRCKRMSSSFENADPMKNSSVSPQKTCLPLSNGHHLLDSIQNKSNKRSNTLLADCAKQKFFKDSNPRVQEPLNDYDSESSVLTINYIQYVNDKAKINRKSKSFNMAKRHGEIAASPRIQLSSFKFKSKNSGNNTTFLKNNKASIHRNMSFNFNSAQLSQSLGNIGNHESEENPKRNKTLIKKKHFFKQSSEEMRRKNDLVLNTSITSSSSIENSFSDKQRLSKKSFFKTCVDTDGIICAPLSKIDNKGLFSECGSSSSSSTARERDRQQNVSVMYTKVETHYISNSTHNKTDSTYSSMIQFKQTTSFLSEGQ